MQYSNISGCSPRSEIEPVAEFMSKPRLDGWPTMTILIIASCVVGIAVQCVVPADASAQQTAARAATSCEPVFKTTRYVRGVPYVYVDQGLASLPHVYPKHVLLVQRRDSELGAVRYSLLVYRRDDSKPDVTIEGEAVHNRQAWSFSAQCSIENVPDGVVTTLERVAKLSDGSVKQP